MAITKHLSGEIIDPLDQFSQLGGQLARDSAGCHQRRQAPRMLGQRAEYDLAVHDRLGMPISGGLRGGRELFKPLALGSVAGRLRLV